MNSGVFRHFLLCSAVFVLHDGKCNELKGAHMRRRWPVLAATIPLVFGWALAAAYPAAAGTGILGPGGLVQPGGPLASSSSGTGAQTGSVTPNASSTTGPQTTTGGRTTVVTSSNWAGYAATGSAGQFTSVSSSWIQSAGQCDGGNQYAGFWVGLDGYSSSTVEQTGSEVDCAGHTPRYYAWYETYPGATADFPNTVRAGDHFSASVSYLGSNKFQLVLTDSTQNWTQSLTQTLAGAARSSAEVIAEAPCCTSHGGTLPLTNFGTIGFTGATVNNAGLCTLNPVEITMPDASVSAISNCGDFNISYTGGSAGFPWPFGWPGGF
jgi:hypothetical protein